MPLAALTRELAEEIAREFPGLQRLNLSRNALRELDHLRLLPHLAQLDLSHNALRVLPADLGAWLPRLARLNLRGNAIESLSGVARCAGLTFLDVGDNRVELLGELRFLVPLDMLEELELDGNPVETRHAGAFRREALTMLPRLRVLDGQMVTPAERLYSRLQVKSELTIAELERNCERGDVGVEGAEDDTGDYNGVKSDSRRVDRRDTPSARLLTPARISTHRGYRPGSEDEDGAFSHHDDEDGYVRAHEQRGRSPAREVTAHDPLGYVESFPNEREDSSTRANHAHTHQQDHRGRGDASGGGGRRDSAVFTPPYKDMQVQVIIDEPTRPTCYGNRSRDQVRSNDSRSSSSSILVINSPGRGGEDHRSPSPSQQEQVLLHSRVEALERILALHDSAMQKELARVGTQLSLQDGTSSDNGNSGHRTAQLYVKMLSMWREKAVALMVQLQCKELTRSADNSQLRKHLAELEGTCSQLQAQCDVWEQRVKDTEAQRNLQLARVLDTEKRCDAANAKAVAAVRTMAVEREKLQRAAELVAVFTARDGVVSQKMSELVGGLKRVDTFKRRLERVRDRLGTTALLAAHREARLRNTEAAMEAERRILVHRIQKLQEASSSDSSRSLDDGRNTDVDPAVPASNGSATGGLGAAARRLRRHRKFLRPATEAALRALFHRLDVYETGLVRSSKLLDALRSDEGVLRAVGGRDALTSLVAHVELALERQRKDTTLDVVLTMPSNPEGDKITWGEFLLLFLPDTPSGIIANGSDDDGYGLGVKALDSLALPCGLCASTMLRHGGGVPVYDDEGAPSPQMSTAQQHPDDRRQLQQLSRRELIAELLKLQKDRDSLRRRVLADAHDLQTRAAKIRNEWKRKTEQLACANDDLRRALEASCKEAASLREQCEEAERESAAAQHALDNLRRESLVRESDFAREKQSLECQREESVQREQEIWKKELQDAAFRHSTLQTEHVKQQAHLRRLERELANMKDRAVARESERVASLESRVEKRDGEISKLRRERNALLNTLRDQEHKLLVQSTEVSTANVQTQTTEVEPIATVPSAPVPIRSIATQTLDCHDTDKQKRDDEGASVVMKPNQKDAGRANESGEAKAFRVAARLPDPHAERLSPEDVTRRLERLQSLTASLLDD